MVHTYLCMLTKEIQVRKGLASILTNQANQASKLAASLCDCSFKLTAMWLEKHFITSLEIIRHNPEMLSLYVGFN